MERKLVPKTSYTFDEAQIQTFFYLPKIPKITITLVSNLECVVVLIPNCLAATCDDSYYLDVSDFTNDDESKYNLF